MPSRSVVPMSDRLRNLWVETLGVSDIADDDDFFDIGGNSLSAVELVSRIREQFGVELNVGVLFDAPTVAHLATMIEQAG